MVITSTNNETIKNIKKLNDKKYRDKENMYIIEGIKIIEEAYKAEQEFAYIIICNEILNKVGNLLEDVKKNKPLVHSITNYVTATDCANIILAIGGSPTMADFSREVEAITGIASAVVLNMGIINDDMVEAMIISGKKSIKISVKMENHLLS
jgi:tRNA G18 (ribose-2'-O)-methylase SpoU